MFKKIKKLLSRFDDVERHVEYVYDHITSVETKVNSTVNEVANLQSKMDKLDKLDEIGKLVDKVNELTAENLKLKEENSVYLKYYDINSEATDKIKKEVFTEFELRRLQITNEALQNQLQYTRDIAATTCMAAYNTSLMKPWGY